MKFIIIILMIIATVAKSQQLEQIKSFVNEVRDSTFYQEQAKLWKTETIKQPKNANAWFNYYSAVKYSNYTKQIYNSDNLNEIMVKMQKQIPNSFEYNYLMYLNGGNNIKYAKYLLKAYEISPNNSIAYPSIVTYCDIVGNDKLQTEVLIRWQNKEIYPSWKLYQAYNALIGLDKNAVIISNGDNNVYSKQLLQTSKKIRKDVKVIVMALLFIDEYYEKTLKELNISVKIKNFDQFAKENPKLKGQEFMNSFLANRVKYIAYNVDNRSVYVDNSGIEQVETLLKENLYLEGIVYKYSDKEYDNIAIMQQNFENKYMFDYIKFSTQNLSKYSSQLHSTGSYLNFLIEIYDFYKLSDDFNNKVKTEKLLKIIAGNVGMEKEINGLINEN